MANTKTDDSSVITTEFSTGRCPIRCELCFVNFGQNGNSVPLGIYTNLGRHAFGFATCETTLQRLRKDAKDGSLDYLADHVCGTRTTHDNNRPRNWKPVKGTKVQPWFEEGEDVQESFHARMSEDDFEEVLRPLHDDPGMYEMPKVPENPWTRRTLASKAYNGQYLPAVLRVSSMSDSSTAPTKWCEELKRIWGDDCFFNSSIHAIKRFPKNMSVYHKLVVTANPGLQAVYAGLDRYKMYFPTKEDQAMDPELVDFAKDVYPELRRMTPNEVTETLADLSRDELDGLILLRLGAGSMKGEHDRYWHFYDPGMISELGYSEEIIKFYRIRALPTIQPHVDKFLAADVPIVYTVLRFKDVSQACMFARKYRIEAEFVIGDERDAVICDFYMMPHRYAEPGEQKLIRMRSDRPENGSPNKGEWTYLYYSGNFFRAGKEQMGDMEFVCDRASNSCKACGLCSTLDGTEANWENPVLAQLGIKPKHFDEQVSYVADSNGLPVATKGVKGHLGKSANLVVSKGVKWESGELEFFKKALKKYGVGFRSQAELDKALKKGGKAKLKELREENPGGAIDTFDPLVPLNAIMSLPEGRRRNPSARDDDEVFEAMVAALRAIQNETLDIGDGKSSWNRHEERDTAVAHVYWNLMAMAKRKGMTRDEAVATATQFSYDSIGMDIFADDMTVLSAMYDNTSYWTDQFGET